MNRANLCYTSSVLTLLIAALVALVPVGLFLAHLTTIVGLSILTPIVFVGTAAFLFRRGAKGLEPLMKDVERHLTGGRRELAIKTLAKGFALGRWNPFLPKQINGQIGILHYAFGELEEAERDLAKAGRFPWTSAAYLGCVYFKMGNEKAMRAAFDKALSFAGKEPIAYALYAYCLRKLGRTKDAIEILEKGLTKTRSKKEPPDPRLEKNLELLKEGKKMKPQLFGEKWAQFQIDGNAGSAALQNVPRHMRGMAQRPGFRPGFRNGLGRRSRGR